MDEEVLYRQLRAEFKSQDADASMAEFTAETRECDLALYDLCVSLHASSALISGD